MEKQTTNLATKKPKIIVRICDAIITICLTLIFFSLPLFFLNLTYQGIAFEKQILFYFLVFLAVVAWAVKSVILGELRIRRTPLDIPIIFFFVAYLLATIFSVDLWHSFFGFFGDPSRGFLSISVIILFYYLIFSNFNFRRSAMILVGLVFSGLVFSFWTLISILGIRFTSIKWLASAPIILSGSASSAGVIFSVMIILFITFVFLIQSDDMGRKIRIFLTSFAIIGIMINLFLLIALYNFIPWEGLLVGLGIFLIYALSRIIRPSENWTWLLMMAFLAVMVIRMIGAVNISRVDLPIEISPSYSISTQIAKGVMHDRFILGSGPGTYGYDFSLYRPVDFNQNYFYNLRFYQGTGILAEGIATLGILGILTVLLLLATYLSVCVYHLSREKERNKIFSLGLISSTVVILFYIFTTQTGGAILLWGSSLISLALAVLIFESDTEDKALILNLKTSPKYALTLAFVFMIIVVSIAYLFVFIGKTLTAELYAGSAVRQEKTSEEVSILRLAKAINLYPKEGRYYTRIGQEYMVLANNEMKKEEKDRDINKIQNYLNNSIVAGVKGMDLMKSDILAVESLGQIYENAGFYISDSLNLAHDTYKQAQSLEPHNPNYFVKLGQIKITQASINEKDEEKKKLINEAKELFKQSVNEKKDFDAGYYQIALSQEILGEMDDAIVNMSQAFQLDNSNINYAFNLARLYQERGKENDNKIAEDLFKQILGVNDKEINTHFNLGLLYEKTKKNDEAIVEYRKVLELLFEVSLNEQLGINESRDRMKKMIENIQNGVSNLSQDNGNIESDQISNQSMQVDPIEQKIL